MSSKQHLANILQRYPWMATTITRTYRLSLPRYSAGVVGVLLDDNRRVLLVEHVFHALHPWGLPGGWVGWREQPADAIAREFLEETSLAVQVVRPILVQKGHFWRNHLDVAYLLRADSAQEIRLSYELLNYAWHALDDLPPLGSFHSQTLAQLKQELAETPL